MPGLTDTTGLGLSLTAGLGLETSAGFGLGVAPGAGLLNTFVLSVGGKQATLDLNFTNNFGWNSTSFTTPAATLTCTRASSGYYQNAAGFLVNFPNNNTLRIGTNGLLIEQSVTNLILQSNTFGVTWAPGNLTNLTTTTTGPDAIVGSATLLNETTTNAGHSLTQSVTKAASAIAYTLSIYAASGPGRTRLVVNANDGAGNGAQACFDLTGTTAGVAAAGVGTPFTSLSSSIASLANGWFRCTLNATSNTTTTIQMQLFVDNGSGTGAISNSYAGTVGNGVYIFGAQVESVGLTTPTSYIPTTTGAVTRSADVVTLTTPGTIPTAGTGSWYAQVNNAPFGAAAAAAARIIGCAGIAQTPLFIGSNSTVSIYNGTTILAATLGSGAFNTGTIKAACAFAPGARAICGANGTVATDTVTQLTTATNIEFGCDQGTGQFVNGYLKRAAYWTVQLTNANLQTLTTGTNT